MRRMACLAVLFLGRAAAAYADVGEPLDLSAVLRTSGAAAARNASLVALPGWSLPSYSGFFATEAGKNMFMWYFPAQKPEVEHPPLVIWLQGGPGGSSMFGLFAEMGPFGLTAEMELEPRLESWNVNYDMLFIDNPVGAGFSYTADGSYCADTRTCVARNLYRVMTEFYSMFPEKLRAPLYITGESYAGHYVPAMAAFIHEQNSNGATPHIPLAGLAIGDGWIDPVNMIPGYPDLVFALGLADSKQRKRVQLYCDATIGLIQSGDYVSAFEQWDEMLNGDVFPYANFFHNISGSNDYDNFLNTNAPASFDYFAAFVDRADIRKALHVGKVDFGKHARDCEKALLGDFHVSYRPELETVLNASYKVLIYSGQLDVIIGTALTERALPFLQWPGAAALADADRAVWRIKPTDTEVAGFATQVGNFTRVVVRAAGHIVPGDQPARALDMITRFIEGTPYANLPDPAPSPEL
ncbi:Alpha/Beta hydrolase protein [Pelagophyceae sp. CCMP2097]|nr:Alpha/Beta hydrolase protein [Pelagophyceae sp. CCMP2097]